METLYSMATKEPSGCCLGGRRGEWSQAHCDSHLWVQNKTPWVKYWFELISMWPEPGKSGRGWGVVEVRKT